ncbi:MAG: hypothetical protein H0W75_00690 [Chitinophagaceae bacterium]|nr:hypothetical protein [Chitinophagaceae bacterium]
MTTEKKVRDSEGNVFTIVLVDIFNSIVILKGEAGEKQISVLELEFYETI